MKKIYAFGDSNTYGFDPRMGGMGRYPKEIRERTGRMMLRDKNGLTEEAYLKTYNSDAWKKPSLTADICIRRKLKGNIYGWWTAFK